MALARVEFQYSAAGVYRCVLCKLRSHPEHGTAGLRHLWLMLRRLSLDDAVRPGRVLGHDPGLAK
eukprot:335284-Rhodomonas_salina.1